MAFSLVVRRVIDQLVFIFIEKKDESRVEKVFSPIGDFIKHQANDPISKIIYF